MADSILDITGRVGSTVRAVASETGIGLRSRTHGAGVAVDLAPEAAFELGAWLVEQARAQGVGRTTAADRDGVCRASTAEPAGHAAARGSHNRRSRVGRKPPPTR